MESKKYMKNLIFNFDETSLLKKKYQPPKCVVSSSSTVIPQVDELSVITKTTAAFCIAADGSSLPPALILPSSIPKHFITRHKSPSVEFYQSESGFITSEIFQHHLLHIILPEIRSRQERFRDGPEIPPALLLLDGHSTRLQRDIWEIFHASNVDVCILPAHTSHVLQPLDCGVNAKFKALLTSLTALPPKRQLDLVLDDWLERVEDAIIGAQTRPLVRHCFQNTGLFPLVPEIVLRYLPDSLPEVTTKRRQKVQISGTFITEETFLAEWKSLKQTEKGHTTEKEDEEDIDEREEVSESEEIPEEY
jgi:hypothetical protein